MSFMFAFARDFNQDLGDWNVSLVNNMKFMFLHSAFDQDLSRWNVTSVTSMSEMFSNDTLSTANYDALLLSWSVQTLQNNVRFDAGVSTYSASSQGARDTLTNVYNWMVTDGGVSP